MPHKYFFEIPKNRRFSISGFSRELKVEHFEEEHVINFKTEKEPKMKISDFWTFQMKIVPLRFRQRKNEKSFSSPKILEFVGNIGIISNDF